MKNWTMLIGSIFLIGALTISITMPISLADQNKIEIGGELPYNQAVGTPTYVNEYKIGQLQKGDEIKVVMYGMKGEGNARLLLANTSINIQETCLNLSYEVSMAICKSLPCLAPCYILCGLIGSKPTVPVIAETTITFQGEEKTFTIEEDGIYYLCIEAEKGTVIYKGYIEVIRQ